MERAHVAEGAIRLVLIDAQPVIRTGLRILLAEQPALSVVGEAGDCDEGVRLVFEREPDVAVVALDQFDDGELARAAEALVRAEQTRVLAISNACDAERVLRAAGAGALGLVGRDEPVATLVDAIVSIHAGEAWFRRRSVATILTAMQRTSPALGVDPVAARMATLTRREREIVPLLCEGLPNRAIAARLFISETTVRHHLTKIFEKLEVANRMELLGLAHHGDLAG